MTTVTKFDCIWYVKSDYWQAYSRYLGTRNGFFIEVDLHPANWTKPRTTLESILAAHRASWGETARGRIRVHCTARSPLDVVTWDLPPKPIIDAMNEMLGKYTTDWLLYGDLLENVDWERYDAIKNKQSLIFLDQIWKVKKDF